MARFLTRSLPIITLVVILFTPFFVQTTAHAQIALGVTENIALTISPQYPRPGDTVTVSLDAYTVNTIGATVLWYVNDVEQPDLRNERTISTTAGGLGERSEIRATIVHANGTSINTTTAITPTNTDIILEADTYIPAFYKGRALPSMSAPVRAIVITNTREGGDAAAYSYDWRLDGSSMYGGPVLGKQSVNMTMPRYDDEVLSVVVYNTRGEAIGRSALKLESVEPELHFYEDNPLRGLSRKAIGSQYVLVGDEVSVHGKPYFLDATPSERGDTYKWNVNNTPVTNDNSDQHIITLRKSDQGGLATIGFSIETIRQIPQLVEGFFSVFAE